jgi:hypothetical protein
MEKTSFDYRSSTPAKLKRTGEMCIWRRHILKVNTRFDDLLNIFKTNLYSTNAMVYQKLAELRLRVDSKYY